MSDPFVAEIRIFGFNFPPTGWAFCNGQLLPISQNTALFSLLGTTYGGDGKSTFALPDMQGNAPMQPGQGPGLQPARSSARCQGVESVTLLSAEIPIHTHALQASDADATTPRPTGNVPAKGFYDDRAHRPAWSAPTAPRRPTTHMAPQALTSPAAACRTTI